MDSEHAQYDESLSWLFSRLPMFSRIGAAAYKPGLQTTEALDAIYGHPHLKFKSIHVGGTNGKGSTSHMLAAALQANGFKTGLYTSPHLTDFRERIRIDGEMIPRSEVVRFVDDWRSRNVDLSPSFFELTMMMAFDWFAREGVDVAVIEVGMGGRLDSTNVITPVLSVITNISFDHTQFLGDTLEAIAREKAGIIKPGVPVVIGDASGAVRDVFIHKAEEENSPLFFASCCEDVESLVSEGPDGWRLTLSGGLTTLIPLSGIYQRNNILTVIESLSCLRQSGFNLDREACLEGIHNVSSLTGLRGRWQKVSDSPVVICDTGHNIDGIRENLATLSRLYPDRRVHFVLGFVSDKDVPHIVGMFPRDADFYFTRASIPRAMPEQEVASHFNSCGVSGPTFPDVPSAFHEALSHALPEDVIYVGGSTFIVADFLACLEHASPLDH